jgi:hypothetical protein
MGEEDETPDSADSDDTPHERMETYETLAQQETEYRRQKRATLGSVSSDLTSAVERAIEETGTNVVVESTASNGTTQTLGVRFDRADLIAQIADELPAGFTVDSFEDGTVTVEWTRRTDGSSQQRATAIIKAVVAEELTTDEDDLIESAPTRQTVIDRAMALDIPEELATQRLNRLRTLDILEVEDGYVYPGGNFSRM